MTESAISFPLWAIVDGQFDEKDLPSTLVSQKAGKHGHCLMLFQHESLSRTAIKEMKLPSSYKPLRITNPNSLISILLSVQNAGDTYVGLNISIKRSQGTFVPIAKWLDAWIFSAKNQRNAYRIVSVRM